MVLARTFSDSLSRVQVLILNLLELHVLKLVALYIIWVAVQEVRPGGSRGSNQAPSFAAWECLVGLGWMGHYSAAARLTWGITSRLSCHHLSGTTTKKTSPFSSVWRLPGTAHAESLLQRLKRSALPRLVVLLSSSLPHRCR